MTTTTVSPAPTASTERSRQAAWKTVQGAGTRKSERWSAAEERALRRLYATHTAREIGERLGRSRIAIKNKALKLGLGNCVKSHNAGCFKPGLVPWNKGTRYIAGGRSAETRFQPGDKPHTWNPVGHERVSKEGYLLRKVTDTGVTRRDYRPVHHLVWQEAGREIPPGHALVFRDGDKRNFALGNLELVTRADLMRRNSYHNYGPEIAATVQLRGAIMRQINKRMK